MNRKGKVERKTSFLKVKPLLAKFELSWCGTFDFLNQRMELMIDDMKQGALAFEVIIIIRSSSSDDAFEVPKKLWGRVMMEGGKQGVRRWSNIWGKKFAFLLIKIQHFSNGHLKFKLDPTFAS